MASQSLYRKWRSQTFSDLIGQEAITRTLLNAVRDKRLAHAYLFCGPRGTGKTSAARLLAKAVNCANPVDGEPCNVCISCREITAGHSPDVIEIDAASNTGVDNIRDLRETVNLLGSGGHYKVYVIDECFAYGELVTLADGTKMPIGKLVESQWQGEVLSYNEQTGAIEPKPIVRHMRKQTVVPTVRVTFDNNRSIVCTINHKFYTPQGQVCAGHLELGQFVYTNRERITQRQRTVVMAAALGDGNISLTGSLMRARLRMVHGVKQKAYLEHKIALLGNLVQSSPRFSAGVGTFSKIGTYRAATTSRPEIAQIHRELYTQAGKKCITRAFLDQLDELALALWYLDDGSLLTVRPKYTRADGSIAEYPNSRSVFATQGFTLEEAHIICAWHRERWGIESRVSATKHGPVVWLTLAGTVRLHQLIAPHVPLSMEYKLLPQYRGQYQESTDQNVASGLAVSVVKAIETVPMPEFVYNIEVADNHNYFVRDILVANCHMLSTAAFNALLKTLEEPPPHIIFILATTEAHKVLPTVVSRSQRFDFRRFSMRDIVARLNYVAQGEGLELESAAADLLARAAQGGMRDALSLLDQAMAYCGTQIDLARTRAMLGLADPATVRALIAAVAEQHAAQGLHLINDLVTSGADLRQLNAQLAEEWRALLLARAGADVAQLMDRSDDEARAIASLAAAFSLEELAACARVFARNETPARSLPVPQLVLELSFLECLTIRQHGGAPASTAATVAAPPLAPRQIASAAPRPSSAPMVPTPLEPRPTPPAHVPLAPVASGAAQEVEELDLDAIERGDAASAPFAVAPTTAPIAPVRAQAAAPLERASHDSPALSAPDDAADGSTTAPLPNAVADDLREGLYRAQSQWELIKQVCKQKSRAVAALLHSARPVQIEPGSVPVLVLQADFQFHLEKLREPTSRSAVEWALEQVLEMPIRVRLTTGGSNGSGGSNGPGGAHGPSRPGGAGGASSAKGGAATRASHAEAPARMAGRPAESGAHVNAPVATAVAPADNVRQFNAERSTSERAVVRPGGDNLAALHDAPAPYVSAASFSEGADADALEGPSAPPSNITQLPAARAARTANGTASGQRSQPSPSAAPPTAESKRQHALEETVRTDAVIQALMRTQGIELTDVRPLDDGES